MKYLNQSGDVIRRFNQFFSRLFLIVFHANPFLIDLKNDVNIHHNKKLMYVCVNQKK